MKFNKQMDSGALLIPRAAFKISSFEADEKTEIHALDSAVIVLKKQMTAMELIQAADALHRLATELTAHLAMACGECGEWTMTRSLAVSTKSCWNPSPTINSRAS